MVNNPTQNKTRARRTRARTSGSRSLLKRLERVESPNVTYLGEEFPIVLKRGRGMRVVDEDGKAYRDFTACFGVVALGHQSETVVRAMRRQGGRLIHGMGDVHPTRSKVRLLEALAQAVPYASPKSILGLNGADALEAALKTAALVTGRCRMLHFSGAYHGLSLGPLALTDRHLFRHGFEAWLSGRGRCLPFPMPTEFPGAWEQPPQEHRLREDHGMAPASQVLTLLEDELRSGEFAALVMEPLQGRGGERRFPSDFVRECAALCRKYGTLLVFDEIFTGFGRTGTLFAGEHHGVVPDLMCVGKAMGGGFPLSACVGECMDAWGKSEGEARHTSTFLGHPLACEVGADVISTIQRKMPEFRVAAESIAAEFEKFIAEYRNAGLHRSLPVVLRGQGFMNGLWFFQARPGFVPHLAEQLLFKGYLVLPSGMRGDVLSFTPPLIATAREYRSVLKATLQLLVQWPGGLASERA